MKTLDLDAELDTKLGIEVRKRLVEEEDVDVAHQRAPDGDALTLTARQRMRAAVEIGR